MDKGPGARLYFFSATTFPGCRTLGAKNLKCVLGCYKVIFVKVECYAIFYVAVF